MKDRYIGISLVPAIEYLLYFKLSGFGRNLEGGTK